MTGAASWVILWCDHQECMSKLGTAAANNLWTSHPGLSKLASIGIQNRQKLWPQVWKVHHGPGLVENTENDLGFSSFWGCQGSLASPSMPRMKAALKNMNHGGPGFNQGSLVEWCPAFQERLLPDSTNQPVVLIKWQDKIGAVWCLWP